MRGAPTRHTLTADRAEHTEIPEEPGKCRRLLGTDPYLATDRVSLLIHSSTNNRGAFKTALIQRSSDVRLLKRASETQNHPELRVVWDALERKAVFAASRGCPLAARTGFEERGP
jgi:hypothetical protein